MAALRAAVFPLSAKNRRGGHFLPPPSSARVNPRQHRPLRILPRHKPGGIRPPLTVSPLIELEKERKKEHVGRRETKRLIYKLKILGQPVTSEVRSRADK